MRTLVTLLLFAIPAAALASGGEEHGIPWDSLGFHALNLTILIGVIVYYGKQPISDAVRNRSLSVKRSIEEAQKAKAQAQAKLEELEGKLESFDFQVERMRREMASQAELERKAIVERAQREADAIRASAQRAIRDETSRARKQLREETIQLAMKYAESLVVERLSEQDQDRLSDELISQIGGE